MNQHVVSALLIMLMVPLCGFLRSWEEARIVALQIVVCGPAAFAAAGVCWFWTRRRELRQLREYLLAFDADQRAINTRRRLLRYRPSAN
jgi:hypothetical protein